MTSDERDIDTPVPASDVEQLAEALGDEFEIIRKLGEGAMGSVFLARETELRRLVAIKVPKAQLARDETVRKRFEREAQAAARISHRSAASVYRIGRLDDKVPYLVMEYVEGKTVDQKLQAEGPCPMGVGLTILTQVAEALEAAHQTGVIHRDVRPGNVLYEEESSRAVLTDFGIAGILETGTESITRLTQAGQILGDPAYTSPEQLQGEQVTEATDIYSFGMMAFELLTGERPYTTSTRAQLITAHLRQEPRELSTLLPGADARLTELVARTLKKTPEHRPTAAKVRETLQAITGGDAGAAPSDSAAIGGVLGEVPLVAAFLGELKRRKVGRVALIYLFSAWLGLPAVQSLTEGMQAPDFVFPAIFALIAGGFPVTLVLAWMYDLTAGGIQKTEAEGPPSVRKGLLVLQWTLLAASVGLAVAVWVLVVG